MVVTVGIWYVAQSQALGEPGYTPDGSHTESVAPVRQLKQIEKSKYPSALTSSHSSSSCLPSATLSIFTGDGVAKGVKRSPQTSVRPLASWVQVTLPPVILYLFELSNEFTAHVPVRASPPSVAMYQPRSYRAATISIVAYRSTVILVPILHVVVRFVFTDVS